MAETLAELVARISVDATALKKGLAESEKDIEQTGKTFEGFVKDNKQAFKTLGIAVTAFGASITGLLTVAIKSFAGLGTELKELFQKTGISVESLSELKYVGDMTSVSLGDLAVAIRGMSNFMETASSGSEEAAKTLKKLGLSLDDVKGLNPEQLFMKLSSAIAALPDPIKRSALAVDIFGRSGTQLLPMLAEGTDGIAKLRQRAQELGITMSTETANAADALGDALDTVKSSIGGVFNAIGSQLAPIIIDIAGKIADVMSKVKGWADAHPELFKNILLVVGGLGLLALAVGPILIMLPQIIGQIAALKIAFLTLNASLGPVGWAIAGITAALVVALPWILTATSATKDLTVAERDLAEQTARTNLQKKLDAESWALLSGGGKIYETQLEGIATSSNMTTKELYSMLKAAGLVQQVWGGDEGAIYLKSLEEIEKGLKKVTDASETLTDITQGMKQTIARATWVADGYTYSMQLFTKAEIDAAIASGKKVDVLQTQSDVMADNAAKAKDYKEAIDNATASVEGLTNATSMWQGEETTWQKDQARVSGELAQGIAVSSEALSLITAKSTDLNRILTLLMINPNYSAQQGGLTAAGVYGGLQGAIANMVYMMVGEPSGIGGGIGMGRFMATYVPPTTEELYKMLQKYSLEAIAHFTGLPKGLSPESPDYYLTYQKGGTVGETGLAYLHQGETVIPANEPNQGGITINFTEPVFFDREDSMNKFVDKISKALDRKYRLRFGGAYSG